MQSGGTAMKMRLLTALFAAAALSGCATYDYAGGSAPGGYYYGRPSVDYYGPYGGGYGYGSYGYDYGGYGYGYGYSPYRFGYYGGYYPYYPYRPHNPRPPRPDNDDNRPPSQGGRPPPWRRPDGRYQDSGQVMIPPRNGIVPQAPSQPQIRNDGGQYPGMRVRPEGGSQPARVSTPSPQRSQPAGRAAPAPRTGNRDGVRSVER